MRGYFAFLVIIVSVSVTVQASYYKNAFPDSLYHECGIKQWGTNFDSTRKYHRRLLKKGIFAVIATTKDDDPVDCQRSCNEKRDPICTVMNLLPLTEENDLTCQLLNFNTKLVDIPTNKGPESHSYTGGNTCLMDAPGCFENICYNMYKKGSKGGLTRLTRKKITATGQRTPLECQEVCNGFTEDGLPCTHTSFQLLGYKEYSVCQFFHLANGKILAYYGTENDCPPARHNMWSGPVKCPVGKQDTKKVAIVL